MNAQNLVMDLQCPHCAAMLTDGQRLPLHAHVRESKKEGEIVLSSVFGDHTVKTDLDIKERWILDLFCPKCDASLMLAVNCKECGGPLASLNIEGGGNLEFCSRKGCKAHALGGFGDVDQMMSLVNRMMNTPYD